MRNVQVGWFMTVALSGAVSIAAGCNKSSPRAATPVAAKPAAAPDGVASCARTHEGAGPERIASAGIGAPIALARWNDRTVAFVVDSDDRTLLAVDVDAKRRLSTTKLEGKPSQLVVLKDGRIAVALRDRSKLAVFEAEAVDQPLAPRCTVPTPAEPVALAIAPNEDLLVASGWGHSLAAYRGIELSAAYSIELEREPRAVAVSGDGKTAFVAHAVGGRASVIDLDTKSARRVTLEGLHESQLSELRTQFDDKRKIARVLANPPDAAKMYELASARLDELKKNAGNGFAMRTSCQSFALARSEAPSGRIFAPQVLVDPGNVDQRTPGYGNGMMRTEVPSVAVLDEKSGLPLISSLAIGNDVSIFPRFGADHDKEHCVLPRAAAVDDASQSLLVACLGIDSVVAYDAMSADPVHAEKRRWRVPAGPSGIAVDGKGRRAVVWSQFDHAVAVIPLDGALEQEEGKDDAAVARVDLEPEHELSVAVALGRSLFHSSGDQRIARDGRACASCHPDGRDDGLTWATPNGPRRTKMLAGMLSGTAPFSWDGKSPDVRDHLQDTFKRLSGEGGLRSLELRALTAYVESLDAPPRTGAGDQAKVARGAALFKSEAAKCSTCHNGDALTDHERHDVQSQHAADRTPEFDTPSLRFISGRAPYYHDGRYKTLHELLTASDGKMGHTAQLSEDDLAALETYLRTL
jgi:mono/diheme cytochrome c family protein